jgi:hypothetical protein
LRYFNTAGPVRCEDHYCLPPLGRFDLDEILMLIAQQKYFVLHAPRQTGKTSSLLALADHLNRGNDYRCLYFNVEVGQAAREDVQRGMQAILNEMASWARTVLGDSYVKSIWPDVLKQAGENAALGEVMTLWAEHSSKPLVLLIDEIDALVGDTLISVLRQLRAGYPRRPAYFPQSIILCGVRDVRDYRLHGRGKEVITGGSAFNVKAKSLRLGNFSQREVETLYRQHTEETGQHFEDALELAWELTRGQPWLVNALAYEVCFEMEAGRDRSTPITAEMMIEAKERLIQRRETHLDQLTDKLRENRVRSVIEPLLTGQTQPEQLPIDDVEYARDLGLIRIDGQLHIANRIYQEVIPRALTYTTQLTISQQTADYVAPDGRLDVNRLLSKFQQFFRQHSEHWLARFQYKKAGPQLLMQAFLQRIVNHGGRVEREYGLGRMRTDLLVVWPYGEDQVQRVVIELKILYGSLERTIEDGLEQTWKYMDRCGADEGHLVIFDRDPGKAWESKIFRREENFQPEARLNLQPITVWGV